MSDRASTPLAESTRPVGRCLGCRAPGGGFCGGCGADLRDDPWDGVSRPAPRALRLLVCGSRDWTDADTIADTLADYAPVADVEVIHGAARGADTLAAEVAEYYGMRVRAFPADWKAHGKRAGILRNLAMLDEKPDIVIAFQLNGSRGTQHTIDEALRRHIKTLVVGADPS